MVNKGTQVLALVVAVAIGVVVVGQVLTLSATGASATSGALTTLFDSIPTMVILFLGGGISVALVLAGWNVVTK